MLKIKFWRIENVVLMKVLEQGEEIERGSGMFFCKNDFRLISGEFPAEYMNEIYVRGNFVIADNAIRTRSCKSCDEAKEYIKVATEAIHAYNQSLAEKPEPRSDDIEIVIAE